ncbi:MAG: hypothetical protein ACFFG0_22835 [Candidatus Thorarchaeota archaeon]
MSSHTAKVKVLIFPCYDNDTEKEDSINFNEIVIPFSEFGSFQSPPYIYEGNENIKFNERHPVYRRLFLNEFHK